MIGAFANALADLRQGLRMRSVWIALAKEDINDQHRRTSLGPMWLLVNYLAFAGTFVAIFGQSSKESPNYPAYVAIGLFVWLYISEVITQSTTLFQREEAFIKGTPLPLSVYVFRLLTQSVIRSAYALLGCVGLLLISGAWPTIAWAWSGLGLLLLLIATPAVMFICALVGAFMPDVHFIVSNVMRLGMFLTPVFWVHSGGGMRGVFYYWNPFTYFLEIVRIPIISGDIPSRAFLLCMAITAGLWIAALLVLGRFRKQVVFAL